MKSYLEAIAEGVAAASSQQVVGALLVGLTLALIAASLARLAWRKLADPSPILCALILLVSVASMALGLGFSRHTAAEQARSLSPDDPEAGYHILPPPIGSRLIHDADLDRDGRLTPEEAARFVRAADSSGKGWADAGEFDRIRRPWIAPRSIQDFHPDGRPRPGQPAPDQDPTVANRPFGADEGDSAS